MDGPDQINISDVRPDVDIGQSGCHDTDVVDTQYQRLRKQVIETPINQLLSHCSRRRRCMAGSLVQMDKCSANQPSPVTFTFTFTVLIPPLLPGRWFTMVQSSQMTPPSADSTIRVQCTTPN